MSIVLLSKYDYRISKVGVTIATACLLLPYNPKRVFLSVKGTFNDAQWFAHSDFNGQENALYYWIPNASPSFVLNVCDHFLLPKLELWAYSSSTSEFLVTEIFEI